MSTFKPMLSGKAPADLTDLVYPVYCSPKLDGIRALVLGGALVSRNLKPIRNKALQARYGRAEYNGLDGELIAGDPRAEDAFLRTTSVVSSADADASEVQFWVFDNFTFSSTFWTERVALTTTSGARLRKLAHKGIQWVPHELAHGLEAVTKLELQYLEQGYEGLMLRDPDGPYKHGRSTTKEGWLLKLKRFEDAEAVVIDVQEQMHNANEATKDALGRTKRSTHKAGKVGKGTLGALHVCGMNGPYKGKKFDIGTGMSDALRAKLWAANKYGGVIGRIVKYSYFPTGSKDAPRFPVFLGFRDERDM